MLDFAMKIWPWPRGQGQMVQRDKICIFPQAFQIIKPGVDISSNGWDIAIYVQMTLTSISSSSSSYNISKAPLTVMASGAVQEEKN